MEKSAPDEIERLLLELKDDRRDVRSRAAYELGKHKDPRTIPPLISALGDSDKFVRSWAAGALGKAGPAAVDPLVRVIQGADTVTGYYAALALGEIGDLRAVPMLAEAIRAGDYDIRPSAANVLSSLGDASTLLNRILSDPGLTGSQRVELLNVLRGLVYTDEEIQLEFKFPDLADLCSGRLGSDDESVRAGAQQTLLALQSPTTATLPPDTTPPVPEPPDQSADSAQASPEGSPIGPAASPGPATDEPAQPAREGEKPKRGFWSKLLGR